MTPLPRNRLADGALQRITRAPHWAHVVWPDLGPKINEQWEHYGEGQAWSDGAL